MSARNDPRRATGGFDTRRRGENDRRDVRERGRSCRSPRRGEGGCITTHTRVICAHSPPPSRRRDSRVGPCVIRPRRGRSTPIRRLRQSVKIDSEKCRWRDRGKLARKSIVTNRARHLLGTAGIDQSRTFVSPRLWGIASWPTRTRRALRTRVGNHRDDISRRAPHATDSNRPPATRTCSPFAVSPRARVRRARGARSASRFARSPTSARTIRPSRITRAPPAGSCGRSPRVFRRLHGPRDEPHVQALLQGACASTERAVGRSAPRAPAPAPARAVEKYPVSVPFDSAPHLGQTTDLASPAKATRAAVPDRARGEHRPARCSRRALHGGSARVRPPPVAHARPARAFPPYPPGDFTVSSVPYPSQTVASRTPWTTSARVLLFPCARLAVGALRLRARR